MTTDTTIEEADRHFGQFKHLEDALACIRSLFDHTEDEFAEAVTNPGEKRGTGGDLYCELSWGGESGETEFFELEIYIRGSKCEHPGGAVACTPIAPSYQPIRRDRIEPTVMAHGGHYTNNSPDFEPGELTA